MTSAVRGGTESPQVRPTPSGALPRWRPAFLLLAAVVVAYEVAVSAGVEFATGWIADLDPVFLVLAAAAVVCTAAAGRVSTGDSRRAWTAIAIVIAMGAIGDTIYSVLAAVDAAPTISIADIFYLAGYPVLLVALWWIARCRGGDAGVQAMFDGLVLAVGLSLLTWEALVAASGGFDGLGAFDSVILIAYPLLDLLLLGAAAGVLLASRRLDAATVLLSLYLLATIAGDVTYLIGARDESGLLGVSNVSFALALVCIGAAALDPSATAIAAPSGDPGQIGRARFLLLGASVSAPALTAAVIIWRGETVTVPVLMVSTAVLALLVTWRVASAVRGERAASRAREEALERLWGQSRLDSLTGLGNRLSLLEDLGSELAPIAVLFADLDRFKQVNDTSGHAAGDAVLCEVTRRLQLHLEDSERVYRLSGDEFVVVRRLDDPDRAGVEVDRRAGQLVAALSEPYFPMGMEWHLTASVGCAYADPLGDSRPLPEDLLRRADVAMYRAKRDPAAHVRVHDEVMQSELDERHELELALRRALVAEQFQPAMQPIVDLTTGAIVGFESLARWRRDDGTVLAAGAFIDVAEQAGLLPQLNRIVSAQAFEFIRAWNASHRGVPRAYLATNLSASQLVGQGMADQLLELLRSAGVGPETIVVELTEGALVAAPDLAASRLSHLRRLGFRVALDDFGTGYSSLSHLLRFPVDVVKIDRSFVAELTPELESNSVAAATYHLADTLGLDVVAEGIEEQSQAEILVRLGVTRAQGYLFSHPLPAAAALDLPVDLIPPVQVAPRR